MGIINKEMKIYKVTFGSTFYFFIKNNFFFVQNIQILYVKLVYMHLKIVF